MVLSMVYSHMRGETGLVGPHQIAWVAALVNHISALQSAEMQNEREREELMSRVSQ